ncbi:hypothetical protein L227DRAFT_573361 [Lentinus tigrinus ALCF2SS1-6]|uniref:Uncharacterized protein n=1 Tax=Lentinus tigrinus ALCF2SS1-6 TaxID=1328759 RepID=A0A5C2SGC9_9APHY|nr:hypothetical protein L227DRAFT_573361 [Lentinus tigrinus ALCF2SS1-6]
MLSFKSVIALACLAASAAAQSVIIASPIANSTLLPGETFVVDVDRPDTLTGSQEVAIAIGLLSCVGLAPRSPGTCDGVNTTGNIGRVLFSGTYAPTLVGHGHADLAQNFSVQVPGNFPIGPAILSVAHFALVIGTEPFLEVVPQQVIVVGT